MRGFIASPFLVKESNPNVSLICQLCQFEHSEINARKRSSITASAAISLPHSDTWQLDGAGRAILQFRLGDGVDSEKRFT